MTFNWINRTDGLPEDGQLVLIHLNYVSTIYRDENGIDRWWEYRVAQFECGKIPKQGEAIDPADQDGNNLVPYRWVSGPYSWLGQWVERWAPLPLGAKRHTHQQRDR